MHLVSYSPEYFLKEESNVGVVALGREGVCADKVAGCSPRSQKEDDGG